MYRLKRHFFPLFLICAAVACTSPKEEPVREKNRAEKIVGEPGHFRGVSIGMQMDSVAKIDRGFLFKRQLDELNYSIPFSHTDSSYFDVTYFFEKKQLFEIQVDLFLLQEQEAEKLFQQFDTLLSSRYDTPSTKPGYAFWTVQESGRRELEITLRDVSSEYDRPMISLNIIEPQRFIH